MRLNPCKDELPLQHMELPEKEEEKYEKYLGKSLEGTLDIVLAPSYL